MKYIKFLFIIVLLVCSSEAISEELDSNQKNSGVQDESQRKNSIYFFQHKIIPYWLFESNGAFFEDVINGNFDEVILSAREEVDSDFSSKIEVVPMPKKQAILMIFEEPDSPVLCFYAIALKDGDEYSYFTYEQTIPDPDKVMGIVVRRDSEGNRIKLGFRTYSTYEEFVEDILG